MEDFITLFSKKNRNAVLFLSALLILFFCVPVYTQENASDNQTVTQNTENDYTDLQKKENEAFKGMFSNDQAVQNTQGNRKAPNTFWLFFRTLLVLILVVVAIYFIFKFIKKKTDPSENSNDPFLKQVATLSLAPGKSVKVVTLQNHCYVLGVSDDSVSLIDTLEYESGKDKDLVDALNFRKDSEPAEKAKDFASLLAAVMGVKKEESAGSSLRKRVMNFQDRFSRIKNNSVLPSDKESSNNVNENDEGIQNEK